MSYYCGKLALFEVLAYSLPKVYIYVVFFPPYSRVKLSLVKDGTFISV